MSINKWTHVAAVFDGPNKKVSIYIDGVLACSADTPTRLRWTSRRYIRTTRSASPIRATTAAQLKGYISEARVWAKALNGNDLKNNMCYVDPATDGLLAYWRFNEKAERQKGGRRPDRTRIQGDLLQLGHEMGGQRPLSRMTTDVIRTTNKLPFRAACLFFRFPASDYSKRPRTRRSHNGLSASLTSSSTCTK